MYYIFIAHFYNLFKYLLYIHLEHSYITLFIYCFISLLISYYLNSIFQLRLRLLLTGLLRLEHSHSKDLQSNSGVQKQGISLGSF